MPNVKPISFSANMARALLDGRKTQTRRVLKVSPTKKPGSIDDYMIDRVNIGPLPYKTGDLLWVREPWRTLREFDHLPPRDLPKSANIWFEADGEDPIKASFGKYRHARFMPRWASRFTLEVSEVKVERLQSITREDARAEGVVEPEWDDWRENVTAIGMPEGSYIETERDLFRDLWDSRNAKRGYGWDQNPWVAAYTFTVHHMNVDDLLKRPEALLEDADCHDNSAGSP